jgi:hypothetical protein
VAFSAALVWCLRSGLLLFSPGAFLSFVLVFLFFSVVRAVPSFGFVRFFVVVIVVLNSTPS